METTTEHRTPRRRAGPKSARRLYVKAVFCGYKRGHRKRHVNTSLFLDNGKISLCLSILLSAIVLFLLWGCIRYSSGHFPFVHGNFDFVRAEFHHNLSTPVMGTMFNEYKRERRHENTTLKGEVYDKSCISILSRTVFFILLGCSGVVRAKSHHNLPSAVFLFGPEFKIIADRVSYAFSGQTLATITTVSMATLALIATIVTWLYSIYTEFRNLREGLEKRMDKVAKEATTATEAIKEATTATEAIKEATAAAMAAAKAATEATAATEAATSAAMEATGAMKNEIAKLNTLLVASTKPDHELPEPQLKREAHPMKIPYRKKSAPLMSQH
uniref:DUF4126 domain-containing protein n=1 Tax=Globodera pallida TaxID=36090 RepID=A0A183BPZ7_GLOPA